jgi:regulator of protease activity HflC (stomatin/prohibitin superfamily)
VQTRLSNELSPYSIQINDLLIDNIDFRPEFKQAIEDKQITTQNALAAQEKVKQKEFEAQQNVATAKGEADAIRERANGQADANKALAASLTPEVIQFQALEKLADNVQIALIPSGQGIILDPSTFLGGPGSNTSTAKP